MTQTFQKYQRLTALPLGKRLFSLAYAQFAPYFWTVRPQVREVRPHYAELSIRKRRAVQNHIGTFHVIAVANGLEAAMGLLAEATVADTQRWIPRGMELTYPAKATTDLLCVAESEPARWEAGGDVPVRVKALRTDGTVVVQGIITLYVSAKPNK
ncbi:hotdog fold domain-containing protein [Kocuria sp.]|uniref:hotdog fold domain-containing protein n=1 Tax=Kocuria sp. TaxID=1871328 RepID=UPI0026DEC193|nr:hotdog fold domain-containing protein [Kocuria sp.]MDO5617495.1 hotdog fold domain-containing protein [Kocuria sp.]